VNGTNGVDGLDFRWTAAIASTTWEVLAESAGRNKRESVVQYVRTIRGCQDIVIVVNAR
jgi:hypothetical protein